jgi:urease accessory protein UreH
MRVPLTEVGRRGRFDATFHLQHGQTVLRQAYCEVPFKITRVLNSHPPLAHLILMHCTAGLFAGDELESSIRIERGARVLVTQQSATKIHPSIHSSGGCPAIQRNHIVVEEGAELQLYLEPVIPFPDSVLRQTTKIEVESGGRLVFWEAFMAGRVGRGESWRFRELASETRLISDGRLVYLDRFRVQPNGSESCLWGMGTGTYLATGLCVGEQAASIATTLHQVLPRAGIDTVAKIVTVARLVSDNGSEFHRSQEIFRRDIQPLL